MNDLVRKPRYEHYTPLNAERSLILEEFLSYNLLSQTKKSSTPPNVDPNKYCMFHYNYRYTVEECMIQAGHLC